MSTTVIDSLVLELGLDPSKFTAGQRAALDNLTKFQQQSVSGGKEIEAQTKRIYELLSNFRREAIATVGLIFGGREAKDFVGFITNLDAATGRFAKTVGISASEVSTWQGAIKQVGGTADEAKSGIGGLNSEVVRFSQTGQSSALGVLRQFGISLYDQNRNLKTATQLYHDLAEAVEMKKLSARDATGFLSMIPGMTPSFINLLLEGSKKLDSRLGASSKYVPSDEDVRKAQALQEKFSLLQDSGTNAGRSLMSYFYAPLAAIVDKMREFVDESPKLAAAVGLIGGSFAAAASWPIFRWALGGGLLRLAGRSIAPVAGALAAVEIIRDQEAKNQSGEAVDRAKIDGLPWYRRGALWVQENVFGADVAQLTRDVQPSLGFDKKTKTAGPSNAADGSQARTMPGYDVPLADVEAYIRKAAITRKIDPEQALRVARSEGLFTYKSAIPGEDSVGPFQLHYGGGLGDVFTKRTGLDAHDTSTWKQQVDFALDEAKRSGWGPWHGWKGLPYAGIGAPSAAQAPGVVDNRSSTVGGDNTTTVSATIGSIHVNAPNARDADGVAQEIGPALRRNLLAGAANNGLQ